MLLYIYIDVLVGFFDKVVELFWLYSDKMIFKVFDVEKQFFSQGYEFYLYDIVVVFNVFYVIVFF